MRVLLILTVLLIGCSGKRGDYIALSNPPLHSIALEMCPTCKYYVVAEGKGHTHDYEPSPKDVVKVENACAFVKVKGLDGWAQGWRGVNVALEEPHFWLYRDGVVKVAEVLDSALKMCQGSEYKTGRFRDFLLRVDSLFSVRFEGKACVSTPVLKVFLEGLGIGVPCVLRKNEFSEPSEGDVERFGKALREVGVLVLARGEEIVAPVPENVKVVEVRLHPHKGEMYSSFLRDALNPLYGVFTQGVKVYDDEDHQKQRTLKGGDQPHIHQLNRPREEDDGLNVKHQKE